MKNGNRSKDLYIYILYRKCFNPFLPYWINPHQCQNPYAFIAAKWEGAVWKHSLPARINLARFELKRIQVGNYIVLINSSDCRRIVTVSLPIVSVARTSPTTRTTTTTTTTTTCHVEDEAKLFRSREWERFLRGEETLNCTCSTIAARGHDATHATILCVTTKRDERGDGKENSVVNRPIFYFYFPSFSIPLKYFSKIIFFHPIYSILILN